MDVFILIISELTAKNHLHENGNNGGSIGGFCGINGGGDR